MRLESSKADEPVAITWVSGAVSVRSLMAMPTSIHENLVITFPILMTPWGAVVATSRLECCVSNGPRSLCKFEFTMRICTQCVSVWRLEAMSSR